MEAKTFLGSDPSISNECPKYKAEIFERKKLLSIDSKVTRLPKAEGGRTFNALKYQLSPHFSEQLRAVCYGHWKSPFPAISHPLDESFVTISTSYFILFSPLQLCAGQGPEKGIQHTVKRDGSFSWNGKWIQWNNQQISKMYLQFICQGWFRSTPETAWGVSQCHQTAVTPQQLYIISVFKQFCWNRKIDQ